MRKILIALVVTLFIAYTTKEAAALVVYDPSNYAQNLQSALNSATQIQNQMKQLENDAANLQYMDSATASATMYRIQDNLAQLQMLQQQTQGMVMDYTDFQTAWDQQYQDFSAYSGMTGADYAEQAMRMTQTTQNQIYDAMRAQGLIAQAGNDAAALQQLLAASQSAQGARAAAQAGNQIAAMQAQSLMKLQQMIAQNNQAQLAYQQQKLQQDMAAEYAAAQAYTTDVEPQKRGQGSLR